MNAQKKHARMFFLVVMFLLTTKTYSQDPNFHIYICFGQSNMEGMGPIEAQDKIVDSRFQVMASVNCSNLGRTKGNWYTAIPPLCRCYTQLTPADYFGKTMVANLPDSVRVGVINVAVGGSSIDLFIKDKYQTYISSITADWLKSAIKEYDNDPYARLVEMAKLAQKDGVIKGILLHQGETNAGDTKWPSNVKTAYGNLLTDLNLNPDSVPLLAGEVVDAEQGGLSAAMNSIINTLPKTIPNAYVISSKGCTAQIDGLHFTSLGYRILGMRYAAKMLSLMGIEPKILEPEAFNFEAECSIFGDNWNTVDDTKASNNSYVTIKPGLNNTNEASSDSANTIYFDFTAKSDTTFYVYARVNCPTANNNSFWVKMDDEPFEYVDNLATGGWKWLKLKSYNLKAGVHTLAIANGEEGAKIDKIFIANYDLAPTGMGSAAVKVCNNTVYKVPGKIEAEQFSNQYGIQTENTGDTGGGLNLGWIDANDWMEYTIDVASDTIYNATFRCASPNSPAGAVSILVDGVKIGSVSFTGTGAWQTYESFSKDIPLKAGKHILKLLVTTSGFNFNWFMFEKKNVTGINDLNESGLSVFPNPTNGELNIKSNSFQFDNIEILDCTGKKVFSRSVDPAKRISFNPCLQKGIYIVKATSEGKNITQKLIVQ